MRISILTASGKYNLGDELILRQEFFVLKKSFPNARFSIFTYDQKSTLLGEEDIDFISFFPNRAKSEPLANIRHLIKNIFTIAKSNLIVIGGGGLIYDRETQTNMFPLWQWIFRVAIAQIFRIPIVWWAVGINITQESNKKYLPFLFGGKNTIVTVRDEHSHTLLRSLGIQSDIIPDPVLTYTPSLDQKSSVKNETPTVGISLRSGYVPEEFSLFKEMIESIREAGFQIIFLSQSLHPEDPQADDSLFVKQFAKNGEQITTSLTETLETYPKLDFVIGMRLHSLILSLVHGAPFLALSYETKTREFLKSIDYPHILDVKTLRIEDFQQAFGHLTQTADEVKFALGAKNDTIRALSEEGTRKLLDQINHIITNPNS